MPLISYDKRSILYSLMNHSANVISYTGTPDEGWSGKTFTDVNGNKVECEPVYGVELEISTDYNVQEIIDAFPEIFAVCKADSSVNGSKRNAYEIVTIPAPLRKQRRNWMHFFQTVDENKFDLLDKHNNGMHVHIDRNAFDADTMHLKKFAWFFANPSARAFLVEMSERDLHSLDSYANIARAKKFSQAERALMDQSKYSVVNMTKGPTVEVRLFKGIFSPAAVLKNLEFVDSVLEFTRIMPIKDVNLTRYLQWIKASARSRWRTFKMCLEDFDLALLEAKSEINKAIEAGKPHEFVDVLNQYAHHIDNEYRQDILGAFMIYCNNVNIQYDKETNKYSVKKIETRFSKFNGKVNEMYRNRLRNAA